MKIKVLASSLVTAGKVYSRGDVVDLRDKDAKPLVDSGAAEAVKDAPKASKNAE